MPRPSLTFCQLLSSAIALACLATTVHADTLYHSSLIIPGENGFEVAGINANGDLVGNTNGGTYGGDIQIVHHDNTVSTFTPHLSQFLSIGGIDNNDNVVFKSIDGAVNHSYLMNATGQLTAAPNPTGDISAYPYITADGRIFGNAVDASFHNAGAYQYINGQPQLLDSNLNVAVERINRAGDVLLSGNGTPTSILHPDNSRTTVTLPTSYQTMEFDALNNDDSIVTRATTNGTSATQKTFLLHPDGTTTPITPPPGYAYVSIGAMNDNGIAFGVASNSPIIDSVNPFQAFLYQNGTYTLIQSDNPLQTISSGFVRDDGSIVAFVNDYYAGNESVLLTPIGGSPVPEPASLSLFAVSLLALHYRSRFARH